jgi:predicted deacylase
MPMVMGEQVIEPGSRSEVELRFARLPAGGWMRMPVVVLHGALAGPTVWLDAAIHGDEVCGVEIIRQVLSGLDPATTCGTVLAIPVVNVPGFANGDRYLPDRRDLNRCFPGSPRGSLGARLAHVFMTEVVARCDLGIDLHTGSDHRANFPHVRADLDDETTRELALAFGTAVVLHTRPRGGSLRSAGVAAGHTVLVYEGGEASRFDRQAIDAGVAGIRRVLNRLGMVANGQPAPLRGRISRRSHWSRSPTSGLVRVRVELGEEVRRGQLLAVVADATGSDQRPVRSRTEGLVIGRTEQPVVHQGAALVHVAELEAC